MTHYLPGCDVRKNHPAAIEALTRYMSRQGAVIDRCCRVKERFSAPGDTIVNNCTLCQLILGETHPDCRSVSLYEYVLTDSAFPWADHRGEAITVQDCWRTREERRLQDAVRQCLLNMNFDIAEAPENRSHTKYCGVWLYNAPAGDCVETAPKLFRDAIQPHIQLLPAQEQERRMKEWVSQYQTEKVLVYCNGCERGLKLGGGHPVHLVELLAEKLS